MLANCVCLVLGEAADWRTALEAPAPDACWLDDGRPPAIEPTGGWACGGGADDEDEEEEEEEDEDEEEPSTARAGRGRWAKSLLEEVGISFRLGDTCWPLGGAAEIGVTNWPASPLSEAAWICDR